MSRCEFWENVEAYHDGELDGALALEVEKHLGVCGECRGFLDELVVISGLIGGSGGAGLSQISRHRLHVAVDGAMERGLLRFAWLMSGIAASVLLVGSAWLVRVNDTAQAQVPAEAPPWVSVSLAGNRDPVVREAISPAAQFYLADASATDGIENR